MRATNIAGYNVTMLDNLGVVGSCPNLKRSTGTLYETDIVHASIIGSIVGITLNVTHHDRLNALAILFHFLQLVRVEDGCAGEEEGFHVIRRVFLAHTI